MPLRGVLGDGWGQPSEPPGQLGAGSWGVPGDVSQRKRELYRIVWVHWELERMDCNNKEDDGKNSK